MNVKRIKKNVVAMIIINSRNSVMCLSEDGVLREYSIVDSSKLMRVI